MGSRRADLERLWENHIARPVYVEYVIPDEQWIQTVARWITPAEAAAESGPCETGYLHPETGEFFPIRQEAAPKPTTRELKMDRRLIKQDTTQDERRAEAIRLYESGWQFKAVAKHLHMGHRYLKRLLQEAGVPIRHVRQDGMSA